MTNVRMYTLAGVVTAPVVGGITLQYDSVQLLKLPYISGAVLHPDTSTAASSDESISASPSTAIVFVQVDPGKSIYYELTPEGQPLRVATNQSPILRGDATLLFGKGWSLSCLEVS